MKIMITQQKKENLADCAEKVLHYAGKMMQCIESLDGDMGEYGERRGRYGMRVQEEPGEYQDDYGMGGSRYGMRRY